MDEDEVPVVPESYLLDKFMLNMAQIGWNQLMFRIAMFTIWEVKNCCIIYSNS